MPGPSKTLLTEGSFTELAEEFAKYIDNLKSQQNDEGSSLSSQVATQLSELSQLQTQEQEGEGLTEEQDDEMMEGREAVMKVLVAACSVLNTAPEKGTIPRICVQPPVLTSCPPQNSPQPTTSSSTSSTKPPTPTSTSPASAPPSPNPSRPHRCMAPPKPSQSSKQSSTTSPTQAHRATTSSSRS
jgi:hypothetical protein